MQLGTLHTMLESAKHTQQRWSMAQALYMGLVDGPGPVHGVQGAVSLTTVLSRRAKQLNTS